MRPLCLLLLMLLTVAATCNAQDVETLPAAPPAIQRLMPANAISVLFGEFRIGPSGGKILVHIFATPPGTAPWTTMDGDEAKHSVTRADLVGSVSLPNCHFTVDFLEPQAGTFRRINRSNFNSNDAVNKILIRWLDPKSHKCPIVAVHTGLTHWLGWQLIVFPDGIGKPATSQYFGYGGEADKGNFVTLDQTDSGGRLVVRDEWFEGEKKGVKLYPWDGVEFADRKRPYFLILASFKTRAEADAYVENHTSGEGSLLIRHSDHYPKLNPGYYIVIANRFDDKSAADSCAADLRKHGSDCYVRRAF